MRARQDVELPPFIFVVRHPGRPIILGREKSVVICSKFGVTKTRFSQTVLLSPAENGENDEFAFYPQNQALCSSEPPKKDESDEMADVPQAKAWFTKRLVLSSLQRVWRDN